MSPVVEKNKLLPRSCLFPSDFIAKGHNRTEPSRTHALMGELRHKGIVIFLTSQLCHRLCYKYNNNAGGNVRETFGLVMKKVNCCLTWTAQVRNKLSVVRVHLKAITFTNLCV